MIGEEVVDGGEEVGVVGGPAGGAEFGVGDGFVGPAAFGIGVGWRDGREGLVELGGEFLVGGKLTGGLVVGDVEESGLALGDEVEDGASGVVAMNLIENANAESVGGFFEGGFVVKKFFEDDAALGAVDAGEAEGGAVGGEGKFFGVAENGGGGGFAGEFAFLTHGAAVGLTVDGGGGDEGEVGFRKGLQELSGAFDENALIGFGAAATGGCAGEDVGGRGDFFSKVLQGLRLGEVDRMVGVVS